MATRPFALHRTKTRGTDDESGQLARGEADPCGRGSPLGAALGVDGEDLRPVTLAELRGGKGEERPQQQPGHATSSLRSFFARAASTSRVSRSDSRSAATRPSPEMR